MCKLRASGGGLGMMPKMGNPFPRLGFEMVPPPDGDRLPMIFPDFEENPGNKWASEMAPFLSANRG